MDKSPLQEPFMRDVANTLLATKRRILTRLQESPSEADQIIDLELRGLFHGLLVIFDGGSALADQGLISIMDESGLVFDRFLHERYLDYWRATGTGGS